MNILLQAATHAHDDIGGLEAIHPLLPYFSSFGLGVVVMAIFLWYVARNYKYERSNAKELTNNFIKMAQDTLLALNNLSHIIDAIGPNIQGVTDNSRLEIIHELKNMKEHLDNQYHGLDKSLKEILNNSHAKSH